MNSSTKELKQIIFQASTIQVKIPKYQRAYSWGTQQVEEFWDDIIQENPTFFIGPIIINIEHQNENDGFVSFEDKKIYTTTFLSAFYLCTIAKETQEQIIIFSAIGSPKTIDTDLKKKLTEETGILSEEIEKRKTAIGAPLFYHQKQLLTKSCSISHHGNYGAFAFTLENQS